MRRRTPTLLSWAPAPRLKLMESPPRDSRGTATELPSSRGPGRIIQLRLKTITAAPDRPRCIKRGKVAGEIIGGRIKRKSSNNQRRAETKKKFRALRNILPQHLRVMLTMKRTTCWTMDLEMITQAQSSPRSKLPGTSVSPQTGMGVHHLPLMTTELLRAQPTIEITRLLLHLL